MTGFLYPRLPRIAARTVLRSHQGQKLQDLRAAAGTSHPSAAPAPTGGKPVPERILRDLANEVRKVCSDQWPEPVSRTRGADVDRRVGRALADHMNILRPDASNEGVWSFLSLVLLPDIAVMRFPDRAEPRLLGGARNVFRRTWERRLVLGDLSDRIGTNGHRLGEDELVNIFERSRLARSHDLARALATDILEADVPNRSVYARELTKFVKRDLGAFSVDALSTGELQALVSSAGRRVRGS